MRVFGTDTLETSSTTSSYRAGRPRMVDPAVELRKAGAAGPVADLGRARVYVVASVLVPGRDATSSPSGLVSRLDASWTAYLRRSNAALVGIGSPLLLGEIR